MDAICNLPENIQDLIVMSYFLRNKTTFDQLKLGIFDRIRDSVHFVKDEPKIYHPVYNIQPNLKEMYTSIGYYELMEEYPPIYDSILLNDTCLCVPQKFIDNDHFNIYTNYLCIQHPANDTTYYGSKKSMIHSNVTIIEDSTDNGFDFLSTYNIAQTIIINPYPMKQLKNLLTSLPKYVPGSDITISMMSSNSVGIVKAISVDKNLLMRYSSIYELIGEEECTIYTPFDLKYIAIIIEIWQIYQNVDEKMSLTDYAKTTVDFVKLIGNFISPCYTYDLSLLQDIILVANFLNDKFVMNLCAWYISQKTCKLVNDCSNIIFEQHRKHAQATISEHRYGGY